MSFKDDVIRLGNVPPELIHPVDLDPKTYYFRNETSGDFQVRFERLRNRPFKTWGVISEGQQKVIDLILADARERGYPRLEISGFRGINEPLPGSEFPHTDIDMKPTDRIYFASTPVMTAIKVNGIFTQFKKGDVVSCPGKVEHFAPVTPAFRSQIVGRARGL